MTLFRVAVAVAFSESKLRWVDSQLAQVEGSQTVWLPATPKRQVLQVLLAHWAALGVVPVPPVPTEVRARKLRVHDAWGVIWGSRGERAWMTRPSAAEAAALAWISCGWFCRAAWTRRSR